MTYGIKPLKKNRKPTIFLNNRKIVAEIKTLEGGQAHKGAAVIDDYLKDTGIVIFGTHPLSRIVKEEDHLEPLEKTLNKRMTRRIEQICSSADKQIGAEFSRLPSLATGLLIILNENLIEMHPRIVADRIVEFTRIRPTNIHYCLLISEPHKVNLNNILLPYPLLLDLTYTARQKRAKLFLKKIQQEWAIKTGHTNGLPDPEPLDLDFLPNSITLGE